MLFRSSSKGGFDSPRGRGHERSPELGSAKRPILVEGPRAGERTVDDDLGELRESLMRAEEGGRTRKSVRHGDGGGGRREPSARRSRSRRERVDKRGARRDELEEVWTQAEQEHELRRRELDLARREREFEESVREAKARR